MPPRRPIEIGARFSRLQVTGRGYKNSRGFYCVDVQCDCGSTLVVPESSLKSGNTRSCGCLHREYSQSGCARRSHGKVFSPTYRSWQNMHTRCGNPNSSEYPRYGGRGISICVRWKDFATFLQDMGERPSGTTLDRIDNDGDYEPQNCRWAIKRVQSENTSQVILVAVGGVIMSFSEASRRLGRSPSTLHEMMVKLGCTHQEIVCRYEMSRLNASVSDDRKP